MGKDTVGVLGDRFLWAVSGRNEGQPGLLGLVDLGKQEDGRVRGSGRETGG